MLPSALTVAELKRWGQKAPRPPTDNIAESETRKVKRAHIQSGAEELGTESKFALVPGRSGSKYHGPEAMDMHVCMKNIKHGRPRCLH